MKPPLIPLIKRKNDAKLNKNGVKKYCVGILHSEKSDLNHLKIALFNCGEPEEFLLFVRNFQMTLEASGTLAAGANIQYLCTLVRGKALCQLDIFSVEVVSMTTEHLNLIILGLGT